MSQIEPHAPNLAPTRRTRFDQHAFAARAGAHRARLQGNNQRAIGKIPRTKRPSGLRHGLDLGVRQRIGVRLAQITATANHRSPSVKHDGTDRHLAFRGGLAGQFNRQLHVVTPLHTRHYTVPLA